MNLLKNCSKRLPLSTDIDGMIKEDDELFMPEPAAPDSTQASETAAAPKRPSRLQKVAEQAPPPADDDGVIDMPVSDASQSYQEDGDSPI
jgi:recombinational DNA repair protein RecT